MKLKTNDKVKVITGKNKSKVGKIIQVFPKDERIVVEGVNLVKKHVKARKQGEKGQVIELAGPFHASNVSLVCPKCEKATRVNYKLEAGEKKRVCNKCKELID